jgi:hypothetical protein
VASGGNSTNDVGGYRIHLFTNIAGGTLNVTQGGSVEYLVVGGGGGGGIGFGAGGGAGGYREGFMSLTNGPYPVVVGDGGAGGPGPNTQGLSGNLSSFNGVQAAGGGGGGGAGSGAIRNGLNGGSGGGSCQGGTFGAGNTPATTPAQGNNGANGSSGVYGGGGGGAGAAGSTKNGGTGRYSSISGTSVGYAGGGAGNSTSGFGNASEGGGGLYGGVTTYAAANTGGGGLGDVDAVNSKGGSGIVIVRYMLPTSWSHSMAITFTNDARLNSLTDFPALVILDTNKVNYSQFLANGQDLRFMDASGNELAYEVETWKSSASALSNSYVWVKVPAMSAGCWITAYWGNSGAAMPAYRTNGTVWANGYVSVWHLGEDAGNVDLDESTANAYGLTKYDGVATISGVVGSGASFDGVNDYLTATCHSSLSGTADWSLSFWMNFQTQPNRFWAMMIGHPGSGNIHMIVLTSLTGGFGYWAATQNAPNLSGRNGQWLHVTTTKSGSTLSTYIDGSLADTDSPVSGNNIDPVGGVAIAKQQIGESWYKGLMDEIRISSSPRSADWAWAEYMNMASNPVFQTYGRSRPTKQQGTVLVVR